jgi:uncharacterized integral membrane protein
MRLLIGFLCILLFIALIWFGVTNAGTKISFQVWNTSFTDTPLSLVISGAVAFGVFFAFLIAFAESARVRLDNRRLSREVRRLETEIHYLRTQPPPTARPESSPAQSAPERFDEERRPPIHPASAPVYGAADEWSDPDDDDPYAADRAG